MSILRDNGADPDAPALICEDRSLSWAELDQRVDRMGAALARATANGGRVAVYARNGIDMAVVHLAGLLASVPVVPLNPDSTPAEVVRNGQLGDVRVMFVDGETVERAVEAALERRVELVGLEGVTQPGVPDQHDWVGDDPVEPLPGDLAPCPPLIFTSGTTGTPKGTMLPPSAFGGATTTSGLREALMRGVFGGTRSHLIVGPLHHTGPLTGLRTTIIGATVVIMRRFDASQALSLLERHRIESMVAVPTHFVRLLKLPEDVRAAADVSSLRAVSHTGASCPPWVKRAMIDWWGPVLDEAYGGSESGTVCRISSEEWLRKPGSVGRAVDPFEPVVVDDEGHPVPAGTEGRLYFRDRTGRGIEYVDDPQKTAAAHLEPGVFTLGEIGYVDDDGYVYVTDRASDMVLSGGVNIYPAEAEQVLVAHPEVVDAACVGLPHEEMGEQLVGLVVPQRTPADEDGLTTELLEHCRRQLTHYKCPRVLHVVDELPRNPMGKIDKKALVAELLHHREAVTNGAST